MAPVLSSYAIKQNESRHREHNLAGQTHIVFNSSEKTENNSTIVTVHDYQQYPQVSPANWLIAFEFRKRNEKQGMVW